ncbi:K(+)/H(+) antiporter subunit KhtT [bacterium HR19]|nr:K(+)/H(+) antiporter subunit KhtT [bacterium HR19]
MGKCKEAELPGLGMKYTFELDSGDKLVVIIYNTGKREVYFLDKKKEEPLFSVAMKDEEARQLAFILAGAEFQPIPAEKTKNITREIVMEWVRVKKGSPLAGKSIGENQIRKKTGVTVISIIRDDKVIPGPGPDEMILEGDTLIIVGTVESIRNFLDYCKEFSLT